MKIAQHGPLLFSNSMMSLTAMEFGIWNFDFRHFFLPYCGSRDEAVITSRRKPEYPTKKPPPNPKSVATFSLAQAGIERRHGYLPQIS